MSLLDHLWDDTVAGPPPSGLDTLHLSSAASTGGSLQVTRTITILRSSSFAARDGSPPDSGSKPTSPASAPVSPLTPTTPWGGDWRKLRRKPAAPGTGPAEPRNPTVYDWVVISALDK